MDKFYNATLYKLEKAINELEIEIECPNQRIEAIINIIVDCLSTLKVYVSAIGFKNNDEEIRFFKFQKPIIVTNSISYNAYFEDVFNIDLGNFHLILETERP